MLNETESKELHETVLEGREFDSLTIDNVSQEAVIILVRYQDLLSCAKRLIQCSAFI